MVLSKKRTKTSQKDCKKFLGLFQQGKFNPASTADKFYCIINALEAQLTLGKPPLGETHEQIEKEQSGLLNRRKLVTFSIKAVVTMWAMHHYAVFNLELIKAAFMMTFLTDNKRLLTFKYIENLSH